MEKRKRRAGGRTGWRERNKRKEERDLKTEREKVVLDSPPLDLISFCILCCVPAG